jgi:hypothetical protein
MGRALLLGLLLLSVVLSPAAVSQASDREALFSGSWRLRREASRGIVLRNAQIVDVRRGHLQTHQNLLLRGDEIVAISAEEIGAGAESIDLAGRYVIPGLMDLHAHVQAAGATPLQPDPEVLRALLGAGVTVVRELPLITEFGVSLAARVASGELLGPMVVPASTVFELHAQRTSRGFESTERARDWVRREALAGARWIKIYNSMDAESLQAIVETAALHGLRVCGHTEDVPPRQAAELGLGSMEHTVSLPLSCLREDSGEPRFLDLPRLIGWRWEQVDEERCFELLETFLEQGTAWVPTLVVVEAMLQQGGHGFRGRLKGEDRERLQESIRLAAQWAVEWHRSGVPVGIGTDFPIDGVEPGVSVHRELQILVEQGGATPAEALQMATLQSAQILNLEELLGSVEVGKLAHLVVLEDNPLEDIRNLQSVYRVVHQGRILDPAAASLKAAAGDPESSER